MIRKAKAIWRGTGRAGNGNLSTDSGVLANTPYSFRTRFENENEHQSRRAHRSRHGINAHRSDRSGGNVARPSRQPSHSNAVVRGH
jgi:hypothetical protein